MAKKHFKCNKCGYEWKKGGLSILPKCSKCGSRDVSELKGGRRASSESTEDIDESSEQGLGI